MIIKEKFIHFCFLISTFYLLIVIALFVSFLPLAIYIPDFPEQLIAFSKNKAVKIIYILISFCLLFNWIYCLRFWYKYDRYSLAIILLIFPHVMYAPIYYYQVKIKKRPLKNKKGKESKSVLGRTIQLQEYESESDYENDIKKIK